MKILAVVCIAALGLIGCSSSSTKPEEAKPVATPPSAHVMSAEDVATKYPLMELNSVANLLKVVVDTAGTKPATDVGTDLIGCPLTGQQASGMTMPIKALIDQQIHTEATAYSADPKNYSNERGFETCASTCSCGVLSDIVEMADSRGFNGSAARLHARNKQHLSAKASHQTARDSLACARKQSWFCASDLKTFLEKDGR